jgi:hypothetical protein
LKQLRHSNVTCCSGTTDSLVQLRASSWQPSPGMSPWQPEPVDDDPRLAGKTSPIACVRCPAVSRNQPNKVSAAGRRERKYVAGVCTPSVSGSMLVHVDRREAAPFGDCEYTRWNTVAFRAKPLNAGDRTPPSTSASIIGGKSCTTTRRTFFR